MGTVGRIAGGIAGATAGVILTVSGHPTLGTTLIAFGTNQLFDSLRSQNLPERQRGRLQTFTSTQASVPVVYGQTRLGGTLVDARVDRNSDNDEDLYQVIAICLGSENGAGITEVENIWFDGDYSEAAIVAPGFAEKEPLARGIIAPRFTADVPVPGSPLAIPTEHLDYGLHAGTSTQVVDNILNGVFPSSWTAEYRGRFMAYAWFKFKFNEEVYRGIPSVQFDVKGQEVYDPRTGTWAWSDNPSLCTLDYLTSDLYGLGAIYTGRDGGDVTLNEIDQDSFIAAANYCDETVSFPSPVLTAARFTCNGVIDTSASMSRNMERLLSSCRGELIYEQGKFRLLIRQAATPIALELNEDNIVGDWAFERFGADSMANLINGTFINPERDYQADTKIWPRHDTVNGFLDADNGLRNQREIDLEFTNDEWRAEHILMVMLRESRGDVLISVNCTEEVLATRYGDLINVSHDTPGFTSKSFWVVGTEILPDSKIRLHLQEYEVDAYSLDPLNTRESLPGTDLPNVLDVPVPGSVTAISNSATSILLQDTIRIPRILLTWTDSEHVFVTHYEVQYKLSSNMTEEWDTAPNPIRGLQRIYLSPVSDQTDYDVRIRAVTRYQTKSDWVEVSVSTSTTNIAASADPLFDIDGDTIRLRPRFLTAQSIRWITSDVQGDVTIAAITNASNLSTADEIDVFQFTGDGTRYCGAIVYSDLAGTQGASPLYIQTIEYVEAGQDAQLPFLWAKKVPPQSANPSGKEAIELLATDNGDQVAIFYRTYNEGATPPGFSRFPANIGTYSADPLSLVLEVDRPIEGAPDVIIEGYAIDIDLNESYPRLVRRVDSGVQPSMTLQIVRDSDANQLFFVPNTIDPDTGSYRIRAAKGAKGSNSLFEDPTFIDTGSVEFSGSATQTGYNGGLPFGFKTPIPEALIPAVGEELYLCGVALPTTSILGADQAVSTPRSTQIKISDIRGTSLDGLDLSLNSFRTEIAPIRIFPDLNHNLYMSVGFGTAVESFRLAYNEIGDNTVFIYDQNLPSPGAREILMRNGTVTVPPPISQALADHVFAAETGFEIVITAYAGPDGGQGSSSVGDSLSFTILPIEGGTTVINVPPGGGPEEVRTTGQLRLAPQFAAVLDATGDVKLELKPSYDIGDTISGSIVPNFLNGGMQHMGLDGTTTINTPSNMPTGTVLNLRIDLNGNPLIFDPTDFEGPALSFSGTATRVVASLYSFQTATPIIVAAASY